MRLDGHLGDAELVGDLLVEQPSDSIISTRTCCGSASLRAVLGQWQTQQTVAAG
jgi:hypothetical protein